MIYKNNRHVPARVVTSTRAVYVVPPHGELEILDSVGELPVGVVAVPPVKKPKAKRSTFGSKKAKSKAKAKE